MSAASRVLATTELIEAILLIVPPCELLLSQRVSRTWQITIKSSNRAQRRLFRHAQLLKAMPEGTSPLPPTINPFMPRHHRGEIDLEARDIAALDIRGLTPRDRGQTLEHSAEQPAKGDFQGWRCSGEAPGKALEEDASCKRIHENRGQQEVAESMNLPSRRGRRVVAQAAARDFFRNGG
ncbi:hypothetical protein DOTSEDRAFT_39648 [Dothistroma septosporum NZE10]|uniref:Uncharacterized protein n=1 Tax=Dothistroma septosporum (strain NZE10 / CBS 128990) TaxID=675120 RepID=M2XZK0_DOTSN|nr:hypothetical protein DOTSEDRAFT_39648 [Dothistroma septosporum NZE10]